LKIIHVVIDDKFIDMAIREFEAVAPCLHEYVMINAPSPFRYVKYESIRNLTVENFMLEVHRPDVAAVMFHSLPADRYRLLEHVPMDKKVFWFGWGYDYYPLLKKEFPEGLLLQNTAKEVQSNGSSRVHNVIKARVKKMLQLVGLLPRSVDISVLKRVDYFSPVLDVEYQLVCLHNPWFAANYICWNYGTVEDDLSLPSVINDLPGRNLLVGNSATETNNHFELFDTIKEEIDLTGREVVVPLSYGNNEYRDKVIKYGKTCFGNSFVPLVDFMTYDQYIQKIRSCGFVMMNHIRQQALGNICICILFGAKVFLHPRNPLYNWFKAKGVVVGNIEFPDTKPLTVKERAENIQVICAYWGRDVQREKTLRVIETALA
jgi:dTDP-N-acetylfucosamine:lipid II N-acetylfucosaminyltransferase